MHAIDLWLNFALPICQPRLPRCWPCVEICRMVVTRFSTSIDRDFPVGQWETFFDQRRVWSNALSTVKVGAGYVYERWLNFTLSAFQQWLPVVDTGICRNSSTVFFDFNQSRFFHGVPLSTFRPNRYARYRHVYDGWFAPLESSSCLAQKWRVFFLNGAGDLLLHLPS